MRTQYEPGDRVRILAGAFAGEVAEVEQISEFGHPVVTGAGRYLDSELSRVKRVYLAGPMTGHPQFNFPLFDRVAAELRARGLDVVSPAELDRPDTRKAAMASPDGAPGSGTTNDETWGDLLARDVKLIADGGIEAIVVLPEWWTSRGARLEVTVATLDGKPIYAYVGEGEELVELSEKAVNAGKLGQDPTAIQLEATPVPGVYDDPDIPRPDSESFDPRDYPEAFPALAGAAGEVRVTNEKTGGQKGSKPQRMELLPPEALMAVSEVYAFGATKYAPNNWRKGYDWSLSYGALQRHLSLFWSGEDLDPETGLPHLAHAAFHVLALLVFQLNEQYAELDDRASTVLAVAA